MDLLGNDKNNYKCKYIQLVQRISAQMSLEARIRNHLSGFGFALFSINSYSDLLVNPILVIYAVITIYSLFYTSVMTEKSAINLT